MFATREEEEAYRKQLAAMRRDAYLAEQEAYGGSGFTNLSEMIANGDKFSHHWKKMLKKHGDIAIKYQVEYHAWGNKSGYVSRVDVSDGRSWRGTEGRSAGGDVKASIGGAW